MLVSRNQRSFFHGKEGCIPKEKGGFEVWTVCVSLLYVEVGLEDLVSSDIALCYLGSVDVDYCVPCIARNGSGHGDLHVVTACCKLGICVVSEASTVPSLGTRGTNLVSGLVGWPPWHR